ncbi:MAG: hypothetical protein GY822_20470 [Deltaproteobacteria bacterium]|nr:hypothetical protein [Deltaproteobacteria bacterium]
MLSSLGSSFCFVFLVVLSGCAPVDARFELVFPSPETFALAEDVEVTVYDANDVDALCTNLALGLPTDDKVVARTEKISACALQNGEGLLEALPPQRWVFAASVHDALGVEILRGCKSVAVAEEYIDDSGLLVEIPLATTLDYPGAEALDVSCTDEDTILRHKCQEALSCDIRNDDLQNDE